MTQQFRFLERCFGALVFATAITTSAVASAGPVVYVADVEQLYGAVNSDLNVGATVVLAPGIYTLSATKPHGGRLELQKDMSLYGVAGDRAAVVIDGAALPQESFMGVSFGRTGVVRMGKGTNTIEWLTIKGNVSAAAGIATELTDVTNPTASTTIRVAHVVSDGTSRGIDVRNTRPPTPTTIGRRIDAELVDNELIGPPPDQVTPDIMTEGIRLANFGGADHGVIVAILSGNRAHGFEIGCIVANNRSSNAVLEVRSSGDRFFANDLGCSIAGGLSQTTAVANSNSIVFEAFGSEFVDNTAGIGGVNTPGPEGIRGGIHVAGGLASMSTNVVSGNTVSVSLTGSKVSGNQVVDFEAFGAIQTALTGIAGENNHVTITLRGVSRQIDVAHTDSLPGDPSNSVMVFPPPAP